jgi:Ca2+-binding EF-hand superfamily protein
LQCNIFYFLGFDARQGKPEEMWAEMFNALDEDHNGFVDIDELKDDMATVLKGETRTNCMKFSNLSHHTSLVK